MLSAIIARQPRHLARSAAAVDRGLSSLTASTIFARSRPTLGVRPPRSHKDDIQLGRWKQWPVARKKSDESSVSSILPPPQGTGDSNPKPLLETFGATAESTAPALRGSKRRQQQRRARAKLAKSGVQNRSKQRNNKTPNLVATMEHASRSGVLGSPTSLLQLILSKTQRGARTRPPTYELETLSVKTESGRSDESWFTATVILPGSDSEAEIQFEFESGTFTDFMDSATRNENWPSVPLHHHETLLRDGRVYYKTGKAAKHAAAARAIDATVASHVSHVRQRAGVEGGLEEGDHVHAHVVRLCVADPFEFEAMEQSNQINIIAADIETPDADSPTNWGRRDKSHPSVIARMNHPSLSSPSNFLDVCIRIQGDSNSHLSFQIENMSIKGNHWRTATVVLPDSEEEYPSGEFTDFMDGMELNANSPMKLLHHHETLLQEGKVYYRTDKVAKQAAAARAIDALVTGENRERVEDGLEEIEVVRLCVAPDLKMKHSDRNMAAETVEDDDGMTLSRSRSRFTSMVDREGEVDLYSDPCKILDRSRVYGDKPLLYETDKVRSKTAAGEETEWYSATCIDPEARAQNWTSLSLEK